MESIIATAARVVDAIHDIVEQADGMALIVAADAAAAAGGLDKMATQAGVAAGALGNVTSQAKDLRTALAEAAAASAASAAVMGAADDKAAASTGNNARIMIGWWRLTGNAIHWIVAGTIEFLAVALPAAIAASVGAFVLYQGVVEDVARRMNALYTATESTAAMLHKTTGDVLGLGHAFQTAQDAANPVAYQLLGNYINIARAHMVNFAAAGLEVARAVGELGARIQVDLLEHGQELGTLIAHMVPDLIEFGQIFGNIGHAILNLAADMPGLAELLLQVADAISRVILWISELPRWVILGAAALEEFTRWGGLTVSIMGRLGFGVLGLEGKFFSFVRVASVVKGILSFLPALIARLGSVVVATAPEFGFFAGDVYAAGTAMEEFGAETTAAIAGLSTGGALAIAAVAVGFGILIDKAVTAKDAAQEFGDALEKNIAGASNVQALGVINDSLGALDFHLENTSRVVAAGRGAWATYGTAASNAGRLANAQFGELSSYQQKILSQAGSLTSGADKISRAYGVSFAGALALADVAGVKLATTEITLGRNANIAGAQIEGLVQGYQRMNQTGGILNNDMNVLAIQAGLAGTKVSSLNQALDQFIQNSTGITSSLTSLNQDLTQIGNVGVEVGKKFSVMSGQTAISVNKVAESLTLFSGRSAQTWQNYDAALNQAQQFTDNLRIASAYGAVSQKDYTGAIADTVAALLPFAAKSKTALEELSALAQEGGGPATDNLKKLREWVDNNKISADQFNKAIQTMTGQMSNAGAAAAEFASTLQAQVQTDLANALLSQSNLNKAVGDFQTAVLKAGGQISSSSSQYKQLYDMLRAAGLSAQQARAEMKMLQNTIDGLHGKTVTVGINTLYTQSGNRPAGQSLPGGYPGGTGGQHGGFVHGPGTSTSDSVHAMLSHGEYVMNAAAVEHYGRAAMDAMNARRLAGGGPAITPGRPSPAVSAAAAGGSGQITLNLRTDVSLDKQKVMSALRTETLEFNRRNGTSNWDLRVR